MATSPKDLLTGLLAAQPDLSGIQSRGSWEAVRDLAVVSGVATVVADLARSRLSAPEDRIWCDQVLRQSWLRYEQSLAHLESVLTILDDAGIQPLVLKGPLLARRHYDPPYLRRPSGDLDLAVRAPEMERASDALVRAGYTMTMSLREAYLRTHHIELTCANRPRVELHFRLSHGAYGIPVDEFFARGIPCVTPAGRTVTVLDAADQLMHLVLHFAQGRFIRLFHLYEIRRIWESSPSTVQREAVTRAARYRFSGAFSLADAAFRARWGTPMLTADIPFRKTWLQRSWGAGFYDNFERGFESAAAQLPFATRLHRRWLDLLLTDSPRDAMRIIGVFLRAAIFQAGRKLKFNGRS